MHPARPPLPEAAQRLELSLTALQPPLDWEALFGRVAPRAVEIGTGNGYFLAAEAARLPEFDFIGVEREYEFYAKMVRRCAKAGLSNVRTTPTDAIELLQNWIAPGALTRLYGYFSDPWPKRRHWRNRLFGPHTLDVFEQALAPEGEIWFKTDVDFYFNLVVTAFRERPHWRFLEIGRLEMPDVSRGEVVTNFERKAREAGRQVWGFHATRRQ